MDFDIYVENVLMDQPKGIHTFFNKSLYVKTLANISHEKVDIHLRSNKDWLALQKALEWTKKDIVDMNIDEICEFKDDIIYLFEFYMVQKTNYFENYHYIFEKMDIYQDFNFYEMMNSSDLQQYFFERALYLPNRKQLCFFPFLNTFLLHKDKYNKSDFYRFLRVFNEYAKRMKWLDNQLRHYYDSFSPFLLKEKYSEEDFQWIEEMLFPKEIFEFMDEDYDAHQKLVNYMDLTPESSQMMKDLLQSNDIIIAGSSLMYLTMRDYPREEINDVDIWLLDKTKPNEYKNIPDGVPFVQLFQEFFIDTPMKIGTSNKKGILNLEFPEKNMKFQFLNTRMRDGYSIIENFDFSCVRGFLGNKKNHLILTTDFCESIIHKKLFDVYDVQNMVRQFPYYIQKRIKKYEKRGFELSPYLKSVIEDYEPNPEMEDKLSQFKKDITYPPNRKLTEKFLEIFFCYYFKLNDMIQYHEHTQPEFQIIQKLMKHSPTNDVFELNQIIFEECFYTPYQELYQKIHDRELDFNLKRAQDHYDNLQLIWKHLIQKEDYSKDKLICYPFLYSKMIILNYQDGEIYPYIKSHQPIPIEDIREKYSMENVYIDEYMVYMNYSK